MKLKSKMLLRLANKTSFIFLACIMSTLLTGCMVESKQQKTEDNDYVIPVEVKLDEQPAADEIKEAPSQEDNAEHKEIIVISGESNYIKSGVENIENGHLVCIDPGHQAIGNNAQEPIAPGASETKAKVSSGTKGRFTGVPEYQVNLDVSLLLKDVLIERGYDVIMTREVNEVDISNLERAAVANDSNADVFVRLHCNGSDNASVNGIMTICPTKNNPYCSLIYNNSRKLSDCILESLASVTGAKKEKVWETDTMSGINWSKVPVSIVEMGYMTNEAEDRKLSAPEYQQLLAEGIADGIDLYFDEMTENESED